MIKSNIPLNVKQIQSMKDKGTLNLHFGIQRSENQWDQQKQSLLIFSILSNFFIPPLFSYKEYTENEDGEKITRYNIIDGKQRISNILNYILGNYQLTGIPEVETEEGKVDINGKYFDELSHDFQEEILRFKFTLYSLEDCSEETVSLMFYFLNNGEPLNLFQKSRANLKVDISSYLADMLNKPFFSEICYFTNLQKKKDQTLAVALMSFMLLDNALTSFSDKDILAFSSILSQKFTEEKKEQFSNILDYLHDAIIDENKFMKKINIPIVIKLGQIAIERKIPSDNFFDWFTDFISNAETIEEYKQFCGSGSTKQSSVQGRLDVMLNHFNNYFKNFYFKEENAEVPESEEVQA